MIVQHEVKGILSSLNNNWEAEGNDAPGFYNVIHRFTEFTKNLIKTGNIPMVQQCFSKAELLMTEGNQAVQNAIVNVYVYSISIFLDMPDTVCKQVKEVLPDNLKDTYNHLHHVSYP